MFGRRVVRFDSFSKVLSSGFRIGWMTAPKAIAQRVEYDIQAGPMHASGMSQMAVFTVLEKWNRDGWLRHIAQVRPRPVRFVLRGSWAMQCLAWLLR